MKGEIKTKIEITKEKFKAYEDLRTEGLFNMFNVNAVCDYTGLEREEVFYIMKNYDSLFKAFNSVIERIK